MPKKVTLAEYFAEHLSSKNGVLEVETGIEKSYALIYENALSIAAGLELDHKRRGLVRVGAGLLEEDGVLGPVALVALHPLVPRVAPAVRGQAPALGLEERGDVQSVRVVQAAPEEALVELVFFALFFLIRSSDDRSASSIASWISLMRAAYSSVDRDVRSSPVRVAHSW